ncbi:unannotated protein [freshwater metagenome]|uniref:Unannotated protein n=1 Tax=freshwater metagenome TaxID=449393 RepID=A0A6J7C2S6_9ZZZZ
MDEDAAALDMAQELKAQPFALARTGDKTGDIGDGEDDIARRDDPEVGYQGGEGVVGDLGPGRRHGRDQRGLPSAREADKCNVSNRLELEHDVEGLARLAQ